MNGLKHTPFLNKNCHHFVNPCDKMAILVPIHDHNGKKLVNN